MAKIDSPEILIVDDEEVIREMLKMLLLREGYSVSTAKNGTIGIEQIQKKFFNIAIVDIKLTDMSGMEVMRRIREIHPDTIVLMVTAFATTETAIMALESGVYDYLIKPFDINHIKIIIKRGLEEQRLSFENRELVASLKNEKGKLESVLEIGKMMSSILNLEALVDFIVKKTTEALKAQKGSLMLFDKSGKLLIRGSLGLPEEINRGLRIKIGEKISGWVAKRGEGILVEDIENDPRIKRENRAHYRGKSFISLPLIHKDKVRGILNIADKEKEGEVFSEDDFRYISIITNYAAVALENAQLYEEVRNLAITDGLTGLFNHRYFQEQLAKEINRAKRYNRSLSLVMFDIDNFKSFNDEYGHLTGDAILRSIADILKNNAREVDIVCRYGGEEFIIILPETDTIGARFIADKIREAVDTQLPKEGDLQTTEEITISGGVAQFDFAMEKEEFIHSTDVALYRAKKEGKNRVCIWNE